MAKTDTAKMLDAAAVGGALDVVGMILESNARHAEWVNEQILASKDAEIERLTRQRNAALDRLSLIEQRVLWLLGWDSDQEGDR